MPDFLLEIGTEEIPARMIDSARDELARLVGDLLLRERLASTPTLQTYSTPRRLAVLAAGVSAAQPDKTEQVTGPSLKVAYKTEHQPPLPKRSRASSIFPSMPGNDHDAQRRISRRHGAEERPSGGRDSCRIAAQGNRRHLLGEKHVLARQVGGAICASGALAGHAARRRSCAAGVCRHSRRRTPAKAIASCRRDRCRSDRPADYASDAGGGSVIVSAAEREQRIRKALDAATRTIPGARWREDKSLLDTVVQSHGVSVRRPRQLRSGISRAAGRSAGDGDARPPEVFRAGRCQRQAAAALPGRAQHRRSIPTGSSATATSACCAPASTTRASSGTTDQKIPLRDRVEMLKAVTFQKDLGSYFDKTLRVQKLGSLISEDDSQCRAAGAPGIVFKAGVAVPRPTSPPSW